jgi:putative pyruvate formate lyase activating enzyme
MVSSFNLHFGEESVISGYRGSGAIFFTNCPLMCKFCLNYRVSQLGQGETVSIKDLSEMMLILQKRGAHNINLITPTHYLPHILLSLTLAIQKGLNIPIVYNTSGYEKVEILKFLDGIIDIYLPDFKYADNNLAYLLSSTPDYPKVAKSAIKEMFRQVGELKVNNSVAESGLIIRHLVLPNYIDNSKKVLTMIKKAIGTSVSISLMSQYFPSFRMVNDEKLGRRITKEENQKVLNYAKELGFYRVTT